MRNEKPIIDLKTTQNLCVEHREAIRLAFARAVRDALRRHKLAGNPVAVSENGRVVWISPEDIKIDEDVLISFGINGVTLSCLLPCTSNSAS